MNSSDSELDMTDSRFVLSVYKNDMILYMKMEGTDNKKKYVCNDCIKKGTKRTKRLVYALKLKADFSIKLKIDDHDVDKIKLSVSHPLYDDDTYILWDEILKISHNAPTNILSNDSQTKQLTDKLTLEFTDKLTLELTDKLTLELTDKLTKQITQQFIESNNTNDANETKKPLSYIYVLEQEENKYYIGKSSKPLTRTGEHMASFIYSDLNSNTNKSSSSSGAAWTEMYKPVKILRIIVSYDEFDEDLHTLRYMKDHGIDNVRGGSFCELNLSHDNVVTLSKMLAGAGNKCYFCGSEDHYIASCPQKKITRKTKKRKLLIVKPKDIPKSRFIKYQGSSQLMQNSDVKIEDSHDLTKGLLRLSNTNHSPDPVTVNDPKKVVKFKCRFCGKSLETREKLKTHENIICKESSIVQKGQKIEHQIDQLLEVNKKYLI